MTSLELAALLEVSPATLTRWRKVGMPHARDGRRVLHDPAACQEWVRRNIAAGPHGGARDGAGRRRLDWSEPEDGRPASRGGRSRSASVREQLTGDDLQGLPQPEVQMAKLIEEVLMLRLQREQAEARLVDQTELAEAVDRASASLQESLRTLGRRIASQVIDRVGADPEHTAAVARVVDEQIDQALQELRTVALRGENA